MCDDVVLHSARARLLDDGDAEAFLQLVGSVESKVAVAELLASFPPPTAAADELHTLQQAVAETTSREAALKLRRALGVSVQEARRVQQQKARTQSVRTTVDDACNVCKRRLEAENVTFTSRGVAHTRCVRVTTQISPVGR